MSKILDSLRYNAEAKMAKGEYSEAQFLVSVADHVEKLEAALLPVAEAMPARGQHNGTVFDRTTGHRVFRLLYGAVEAARAALGLPEWTDPYEEKSDETTA